MPHTHQFKDITDHEEHEDFSLVFLRVLRVFVVKCLKLMSTGREQDAALLYIFLYAFGIRV